MQPRRDFLTGCRSAAGICDVAESCTGSSVDCPANGFEPNGTGCDDADVCTPVDECQDGLKEGLPCTDGDILIAVGTRCLPFATEQVTSQMHNTTSMPGKDFPVPAFTAIGIQSPCSTLATSVTTNLAVVGSVNFFDSTIGDIQARIYFVCLPVRPPGPSGVGPLDLASGGLSPAWRGEISAPREGGMWYFDPVPSEQLG
jgi:hypothetical protein